MSQACDFEIVEAVGRGKVMLAARDLLPGKAIIFQESPVMFIPQEYVARYQMDAQLGMIVAGLSIYNRHLSAADRKRFDALYGPTEGPHADTYRAMVKNNTICNRNANGAPVPFNAEETEQFVRVANTIALNAFKEPGGGYVIMDKITRMSHSCLPNCEVDITATHATCRTILPVKKGEEFALEYVSTHRHRPTHFRRHRYLERKAFTCHCPRCDTEADDTREFDCFDPKCPGSCFACQPLNKEPFEIDIDLHYTGVEYVEPHLLPCTVCHRAPPLKYQQDMFALENRLEKECQELEQICNASRKVQDRRVIEHASQRIEALKCPRSHSLSAAVCKLRYNFATLLWMWQHQHGVPTSKAQDAAAEKNARALVRAIEYHCKFPNAQDAEALIDTCFATRFTPSYSKAFALYTCQKALRMFLILHGRDCEGRKKYNEMLVELLPHLPPQPATTTECMFCGESPLCAALTLSRCGRCRLVTYCSTSCQKAHWPIHKKCCKQA